MELIDLRERYDALLETKEKAAALYKQDYQKWRDFKRHLYEETMRNKKKKGYGAGMPPISRERRNTLSGPPKAEKARNRTCYVSSTCLAMILPLVLPYESR